MHVFVKKIGFFGNFGETQGIIVFSNKCFGFFGFSIEILICSYNVRYFQRNNWLLSTNWFGFFGFSNRNINILIQVVVFLNAKLLVFVLLIHLRIINTVIFIRAI